MLIPYQVDVRMYRWPISNFVLIAVISLFSLAAMLAGDEFFSFIEPLVLDGWSPIGLLGHVFLHAGLIHLIGNMIFLWAFGNAVCAKVGNVGYLGLFFFFALAGGAVHNLFDVSPAIGASGAINGVVAMFLIYYPQNEVTCFYFLLIRAGSFSISSIWLILLWLVFDIWGAAAGSGGTAYWAHLGGFAAGAGIGAATLAFGWVEMRKTDRSLFDLMAGHG